jgi:hypothetical protein
MGQAMLAPTNLGENKMSEREYARLEAALNEARMNNVFVKREPDAWQPIGGVVGAIVDKAKQKRDNRVLAEWAGYEDDDLDEWLF